MALSGQVTWGPPGMCARPEMGYGNGQSNAKNQETKSEEIGGDNSVIGRKVREVPKEVSRTESDGGKNKEFVYTAPVGRENVGCHKGLSRAN